MYQLRRQCSESKRRRLPDREIELAVVSRGRGRRELLILVHPVDNEARRQEGGRRER